MDSSMQRQFVAVFVRWLGAITGIVVLAVNPSW